MDERQKSVAPTRRIRFGTFEVDLVAGELLKSGRAVHIQEQPFRILTCLLKRPGEIVSRDDLRQEVWGDDTYVDFERSLNTAVARLREALNDSPTRPVYVETLPRKGYRFIAPVEASPVQGVPDEISDQAPLATGAASLPLPPDASRPSRRRTVLPWALFALTFAAFIGLSFLYLAEEPSVAPLRRFAFRPPVAVGARRGSIAISPNGKHIAFRAAGAEAKLWIQDLDQREPRAIEGTEGVTWPFWSASSDFIGFAAGGEIKKVSPQGGLAISVCRMRGGFFMGGAWSPDGEVIVFSSGPPFVLYEVPGHGGTPKLLISPEESEGSPGGPTGAIGWPHFLPSEAGARVLVFTFRALATPAMMLRDLETGRQELLGPGAAPFYSRSGHLVYQPSRSTYELWALPFSLDTLKAGGEAFPISENSRDPTSVCENGPGIDWLTVRSRRAGVAGPESWVQNASERPIWLSCGLG